MDFAKLDSKFNELVKSFEKDPNHGLNQFQRKRVSSACQTLYKSFKVEFQKHLNGEKQLGRFVRLFLWNIAHISTLNTRWYTVMEAEDEKLKASVKALEQRLTELATSVMKYR